MLGWPETFVILFVMIAIGFTAIAFLELCWSLAGLVVKALDRYRAARIRRRRSGIHPVYWPSGWLRS